MCLAWTITRRVDGTVRMFTSDTNSHARKKGHGS